MTKNPYINAFSASAYIIVIASFFRFGTIFMKDKPDTVFAPMTMLSLLVLSVAFMCYTFFFHPVQMYLEGDKQEAVALFTRTLATFAVLTVIIATIAFAV